MKILIKASRKTTTTKSCSRSKTEKISFYQLESAIGKAHFESVNLTGCAMLTTEIVTYRHFCVKIPLDKGLKSSYAKFKLSISRHTKARFQFCFVGVDSNKEFETHLGTL